MNNVFVLYDRETGTVWYPLKENTFDAVSGPDTGMKIEFISKPVPISLKDWAKDHPDTDVLLPTEEDRKHSRSEGSGS